MCGGAGLTVWLTTARRSSVLIGRMNMALISDEGGDHLGPFRSPVCFEGLGRLGYHLNLQRAGCIQMHIALGEGNRHPRFFEGVVDCNVQFMQHWPPFVNAVNIYPQTKFVTISCNPTPRPTLNAATSHCKLAHLIPIVLKTLMMPIAVIVY